MDYFNRKDQKEKILNFIKNYDHNDNSKTSGIYLLGPNGSGKTTFIKSIIDKEEYDIISYDASDFRTKNYINDIIGSSIPNCNIINMFYRKKKKKIIIMDEMDYMNTGDKGGIKELTKLVRIKKTKRQLLEPSSMMPIIFIGSNTNDKKIKELINVCEVINIYKPTYSQIKVYIKNNYDYNDDLIDLIIDYSQYNLHKIKVIDKYLKIEGFNNNYFSNNISYEKYTKSIIESLYKKYISIENFNNIIKDTDRTTLGLLWHENLTSILDKNISLYRVIIENICYTDYIDRIIFQNQIWQLSEQNSLIKIFYNNYLLHKILGKFKIPDEIIFTKILTKYSTEYNNYIFLQQLEQKMFCSKEDILDLFSNKTNEEIENNYFINKLDVDRMQRFIKNGNFTYV